MKCIRQSLIVIAALLAAPGCRPVPTKERLAPEEAAQARRTISAWLECEECEEGQLEAVVKLGPVATHSLVATLRQGPSPAKLEELRRHLIANYRMLKDYQKTHPETEVPMSQQEYVETYLSNYIALYRSRAAIALGRIGGEEAKSALDQALKAPLREDVKKVVVASRQQTE